MEFKYSDELSAIDNPTGGIAGDIPVRRHRSPIAEDIGALRAQEDWKRYIGPLTRFKGGLSHKYGLMQVAVPECRPERLEIIAYASEIGFMYDDCTEFLKQEEISHANDSMQSTFSEGVERGSIDSKSDGLKKIQSILLAEMMAIDKPRALMAMRVWIEFLQDAAGRQHNADHTLFETYMAYRVLDVGEMFWFGLVTFGMALTIPESELPVIRAMTLPCWVVLALQNDICSYEKEVKAAHEQKACRVVNAVWVLMREHNINQEEATARCRSHIEAKVAEYQQNIARCRANTNLSKDTKAYLESLLYTISGDAAWSLITPRYNSDQTYNELQLCMMRCGVEETVMKLSEHSSETVVLSEKNMVQADSISDQTPESIAYQKYTGFTSR